MEVNVAKVTLVVDKTGTRLTKSAARQIPCIPTYFEEFRLEEHKPKVYCKVLAKTYYGEDVYGWLFLVDHPGGLCWTRPDPFEDQSRIDEVPLAIL